MTNNNRKFFPWYVRVIIIIVAICWYPYLAWYLGNKYRTDLNRYVTEKEAYYDIEFARLAKIEDSLVAVWATVNDTSLRQVEKVKRVYDSCPKHAWRKTDKMRCKKEKYSESMLCEPVKEWVVVGYESYSYLDTTWTKGYKDREEWLKVARSSAHEEAKKQMVMFREYDGTPYNHIMRRCIGTVTLAWVASIILAIILVKLTKRTSK